MKGIETVSFPKGAVIIKEGEKSDGIFFVTAGSVEVSRIQGGQKTVLNTLETDAVFGEMALIDNKPRSATVTALDATECLKGLGKNFSNTLAQADPAVKAATQKLVTTIREKNSAPAATPAIQAKIAHVKREMTANQALQQKVNNSDPFVIAIFRALVSYL